MGERNGLSVGMYQPCVSTAGGEAMHKPERPGLRIIRGNRYEVVTLTQAPMYPVEYFEIIAGSRIVDANSLAHLGFQRVMMRDWGGILMPSVLHGFKAADPVTRIIFLIYGIDKKYQDIHW
ncbi:MAG: hypothetical protein OXH63_27815 [Gemmatimonadetes bacterium]|nr:hypothetical protein [Gemmatimonadota bacterium]